MLCGSGVLCPRQGSSVHTSFPTSITNSEVLTQGSLWPRCKHGPKLVTNSQVFELIWNGIGAFSPIISFLFFPVSSVAFGARYTGSSREWVSIPPALCHADSLWSSLSLFNLHIILGSCDLPPSKTFKVFLCKDVQLPKHSCLSQACGRASWPRSGARTGDRLLDRPIISRVSLADEQGGHLACSGSRGVLCRASTAVDGPEGAIFSPFWCCALACHFTS